MPKGRERGCFMRCFNMFQLGCFRGRVSSDRSRHKERLRRPEKFLFSFISQVRQRETQTAGW